MGQVSLPGPVPTAGVSVSDRCDRPELQSNDERPSGLDVRCLKLRHLGKRWGPGFTVHVGALSLIAVVLFAKVIWHL